MKTKKQITESTANALMLMKQATSNTSIGEEIQKSILLESYLNESRQGCGCGKCLKELADEFYELGKTHARGELKS